MKCLSNWHIYRIHLLALKTLECLTLKASIPHARESIFSVPHEYFSKLCLKVCMLVEFWLSFFFPSNTFLSSPLPNLVDPRLSGAEWEWRLVIHQSTLFTCLTSGVMETAYPPSQALVHIWRNTTVESRASLTLGGGIGTWRPPPTCAALQWDALALPQLVSWAAVEAVVCLWADGTVGWTGLALLPFGVVEALWAGVPTLTLEEVPEHPKLICTWK